jgi:hypothetical protein
MNATTASKFFVLYGAAGTGKSTFAHEMSRQLQEKHMLGAWFFFLRGDANRGSTAKIVPTFAYQLAHSQPNFRPHIARAVREYKNKYQSGSLEKQFESLILNPLDESRTICESTSGDPIVIVLDALDEADGDLANLLKSLKKLADEHKRIRIFITTRHKPAVDRYFDQAGVTKSKQAVMENIPGNESDGDISAFLKTRFNSLPYEKQLRDAHPNAIDMLATKAERLFIYARTAIEHLDHRTLEVSVRRLNAILGDSEGKTGMPALDALYATVLQNTYDDEALEGEDVRERVTSLLAGLVVSRRYSRVPSTADGFEGGCSHQDGTRTSIHVIMF